MPSFTLTAGQVAADSLSGSFDKVVRRFSHVRRSACACRSEGTDCAASRALKSGLKFDTMPRIVPALRESLLVSVATEFPSLEALYRDLHAHPELSFQEEKTSLKLAEELQQTGIEVTRNVGGHGVVGLLPEWRRTSPAASHGYGRLAGRRADGPSLLEHNLRPRWQRGEC